MSLRSSSSPAGNTAWRNSISSSCRSLYPDITVPRDPRIDRATYNYGRDHSASSLLDSDLTSGQSYAWQYLLHCSPLALDFLPAVVNPSFSVRGRKQLNRSIKRPLPSPNLANFPDPMHAVHPRDWELLSTRATSHTLNFIIFYASYCKFIHASIMAI